MALTGTVTQGLEFHRYVAKGEVLHVPVDPGDTIVRGDMLTATQAEGLLDLSGDSEEPVARALKSITCAAATTAFPVPASYDPASDSSDTICPVQTFVAPETPIFKVTFANHADDTVAAYTAATPSLTLTNALGGNDYANGALVYVYAGTGQGQVNIAQDYVDATKVVTLARAFSTALDTTSKVIILDGGAASGGVGFFGLIDIADQNNLDVSDGGDDATGDFVVYMDWSETATYLALEQLLVVRASAVLK